MYYVRWNGMGMKEEHLEVIDVFKCGLNLTVLDREITSYNIERKMQHISEITGKELIRYFKNSLDPIRKIKVSEQKNGLTHSKIIFKSKV